MSARLIMFFISIVCLIFIVSLSRSIYSLWQRGDLVTQRETQKDQVLAENTELQQKLEFVNSTPFVEQEAREKLNLSRGGETVVVLPKDLEPVAESSEASELPQNWQQWWGLFF